MGSGVDVAFGAVPFVDGSVEGFAKELGHDAALVIRIAKNLKDFAGAGADFSGAEIAAMVFAEMNVEEPSAE